MSISKKLLAVTAVAAMASAVFYAGLVGDQALSAGENPEIALLHKPTVNIWYTDETLSDFLAGAALEFSADSEVRVIPRLVSGLEYLETINRESLYLSSIPDLYIIGNDSLEKAYLSGLACPVEDNGYINTDNFPETAIHAVTYDGDKIAYPFYYETSALIYNQTYMEEHSRKVLEAENDAMAGEEADGTAVEESTEESISDVDDTVIEEHMNVLIPGSVEDILNFADSYEAPEQVKAVFRWDVADIFYNYFFVGNYVDVGGPDGDQMDQIDIYNLDAIRCMQSYQQMNEFFSIEEEEVDYDSVVRDFLEGKLVFTIATTDIVSKIEEAKRNGEFPYEYGVTTVPDINAELATRSMSETHVVVVNGYSEQKDAANEFAVYLTGKASGQLFEKTNKLASGKMIEHSVPQAAAFFSEYEDSVPIPKMMTTSNYWIQMEVAFTRIWSGDDVSMTMKELSEQIMTQVTGTEYVEEYIEAPVIQVEVNN